MELGTEDKRVHKTDKVFLNGVDGAVISAAETVEE